METKSYSVHFIGPNGESCLLGHNGIFVARPDKQARFATFTSAEDAARAAKSVLGNTWETSINKLWREPNA